MEGNILLHNGLSLLWQHFSKFLFSINMTPGLRFNIKTIFPGVKITMKESCGMSSLSIKSWIMFCLHHGCDTWYTQYYLILDLVKNKSYTISLAWCYQLTSHYLNQCWTRSPTPYGVIRPQKFKTASANNFQVPTDICLMVNIFHINWKCLAHPIIFTHTIMTALIHNNTDDSGDIGCLMQGKLWVRLVIPHHIRLSCNGRHESCCHEMWPALINSLICNLVAIVVVPFHH